MADEMSKVDTRQFNQMIHSLARAVDKTPEQILPPEVGKVLEKAAQYTGSARISKIRARYDDFVPLSIDSYSPTRARRFGNLRAGKYLVYYMQNRYPDQLWGRLTARRVQLIKRAIAARGLAKKSWVQLADALGIKIEVPDYVRAATPSTGREYNDVTATFEAGKGKAVISIRNAQPTVNAIGGQRALQAAIDGRSKYFYENSRRGVFNSMKDVARAYPGLKIAA